MTEKMLLAFLLALLPARCIYAADYRDPSTGMEFVFVKGGCFSAGRDQLQTAGICIPDFLIGKYEVTQGQWKSVMGTNPSCFADCGDDCPVERVSVRDAQDFLDKLKARTGRAYRLPFESEWEYAARSGGKTEKWAGTDNAGELADYAWFEKNSGKKSHPVGQKTPNRLGIYDMSGNVWEWVANRPEGMSETGKARTVMSGGVGTLRGGSWLDDPTELEAGRRGWVEPVLRSRLVGFRAAISADQLTSPETSTKTK